MYAGQRIQRKTRSHSPTASVENNLPRSRPFKDAGDRAVVPPQEQETPDLQAQIDRAARFGHNFGQVQVSSPGTIQTKLVVGAPGDKYEQEADRVAEQVMSMSAPASQPPIQRATAPEEEEQVQAKPLAASITPLIQRDAAPQEEEESLQAKRDAAPEQEEESLQAKRDGAPEQEEEESLQAKRDGAPEQEEESLQAKRDGAPEQEEESLQAKRSPSATDGRFNAGSDIESKLSRSKGGGSPLPDEVRAFVEPRLGVDLGDVRVHADSEAVQMNRELGARAFTHGRDIYYGAGESPAISHLTLHELIHSVQQTGYSRKLGSDSVQRQEAPESANEAIAPQSGTLDPIAGESLGKSGGDTGASAESVPLQVNAQLSLASAQDEGAQESGRSKADAVSSTLAFGSNVSRGGVTVSAGAFGEELATYSADSISWTTAPGAVNVNARIFVDCKWDTRDLGRTNVSGAADAAVTAATWKDIAKDLKPDSTGRPTRATYWAQDITERHEQFHAKDDIDRAKLYLPAAQAWLNKQAIAVPAGSGMFAEIRRRFSIVTELARLLEKVRSDVEADGWAYYHSVGIGGEGRAYADGKASYQKRVADVKARARSEKWR